MAYSANEKTKIDTNEIASRIKGWGSDLDYKNRPAVPKEKSPARFISPHWTVPEQQIPKITIFKSPEHRELTPVFGTACPPKGLSGKIRNFAYRFSEARLAHWALLIAADRVDVVESTWADAQRGRPDNPIEEMGLGAELKRGGLQSRLGQHRSDTKRLGLEWLLYAGAGAATWSLLRKRGKARQTTAKKPRRAA